MHARTRRSLQSAPTSLEGRVDQLRKQVKSDRLAMSIGELAGLYTNGEIDIHPKFQRILRWSREQKSRLIESILLRIPVPPIFVAQDVDGRWDVVDGVQRLGTIFEFLGVLRDEHDTNVAPLVLSATELLPELQDICFSGKNKSFTVPQQLDFKRSRLDISILLGESDPSAKYELFERLNTGGSIASDQEVRNCVMVWLNESLYDWFKSEAIVKNEAFTDCVQLAERLEQQEYRAELALRFLVFVSMSDEDFKEIDDLGEFLNIHNRLISRDDLDRGHVATTFGQTFSLLSEALGPDAFKKYDRSRNSFAGPFLISAFEAVALGVAHHLAAWLKHKNKSRTYRHDLREKVKDLWTQRGFTSHIGTGVAAKSRLPYSVPFGRSFFKP